MKLLLCFLLLGTAFGQAPAAAEAPDASEEAQEKKRAPVERVVLLLTDLQAKLHNDQKIEQRIYDKYACWCEKATKKKAAAIHMARKELRRLGQVILTAKARIAVLTAEIAELEQEIADNLQAQARATKIREKEHAAFEAETTEEMQAIAALEKAIIVLKKATAPKKKALLQVDSTAPTVALALAALPVRVSLKKEQMAVLAQFAKSGTRYAPQSATVQGILKDMYDTFTADLEEANVDEMTKQHMFEDFMATKRKELDHAQKEKAKREKEKVEQEGILADATEEYDDVEAEMKADIKFFDVTKAGCEAKFSEWTARKNARLEEIAGVSKAIEILSSDEARQLFHDAIKPGVDTGKDGNDANIEFLQVVSSTSAANSAYKALKTHATKVNSLRLASLAAMVRTAKSGHFEEVIKAIDEMIQVLKDEQQSDIEQRDQCKEEYTKIASKLADLKWKIEKNVAQIDKLEDLIKKREEDRDQTIEDIAAVVKHMADITKLRKEENAAYLDAKKDDEGAIKLLTKARDVLEAYYKNHSQKMGPISAGAAQEQGVADVEMLQAKPGEPEFQVSEWQAPDATFAHKGKRKGEAKGIVSIMTMIIEDLQDEISTSMKEEVEAQTQYEAEMDAARKLKADLEEKLANLKKIIAKRNVELKDEHADKTANTKDLNNEEKYKANIKPDCDWILKSFEHRSKRRHEEMLGLSGAKDFLAGYQPSAALLQAKPVVADKFESITFEHIGV